MSYDQSNIQFLVNPTNGRANRGVISDGNMTVLRMAATLESLIAVLNMSARFIGEDRMNRLSNVNLSFQNVINEHHSALRKYLSDEEQAFWRRHTL